MSGLIVPYEGTHPEIAEDAFIAPNATVIGNTKIASGANIWYGCVLRGDDGSIYVGENTNLQDGSVVHITKNAFDTYIGANIVIGHMALIHACTLEDNCFVGMHATVLDGAVVESGAMVAAGALVAPGKRVKKGELWAGNPAKKMRDLRPEEVATWPAQVEHYRQLGITHRRNLEG